MHQAFARVRRVDGVAVTVPTLGPPGTDAAGVVEIPSPAATVEVSAGKGRLTGRTTVSVPAGATVEARIVVKEETAEAVR
jgi:hypothetical protein